MRLTLRTMLAYLDDVLDPADAQILGQKIHESDFAAGLVERIRGVMKKLRMDAPKLDGKGMGNDANTVSEYLDSALTQDRVAEFERVCLESDKHLCEVASCHQILTLVLGKPADVSESLRERIYALGNPDRLAAHAPAAHAHEATPAAPPPVPGDNGRAAAAHAAGARAATAPIVERPRPLEVPDYLRASREPSLLPLVAMTAAAVLISVGILWGTGALGGLFGSRKPLAMTTDDTENTEAPKDNGAVVVLPETKNGKTSPTDIAATPADAAPATTTNATAAATEPSAVPAQPVAAEPNIAATVPATIIPPAPTTPDVEPSTKATTIPAEPAPAVAAAPGLPKIGANAVEASPAKPRPLEVGRYTSDGEFFATVDANDNLWYAKQPQEILTAGERLVVLPPYRPQIALPSTVQLAFAGEGAVKMNEPDENRVPHVSIEHGRFLATTAGQGGVQVRLDLAGISGLLTLVDADSKLAIKVARWVPPGIDPELADAGLVVVEMYNENGRAVWQPGESKVEIPAKFVHVYVGNDPPETHGPFYPPDWIDKKSIKPIDREAASSLEKLINFERPLNLSLLEAMKDRRVEVRSLAARCLSAIGEFEPILRELNDANQYSFWPSEFDAVRQALARSPETAVKIRETLGLLRAADAKELYRLLWGYSDEQLARGDSAQLVKYLEHDQLDVRVLAYNNLVAITGVWGSYYPQRSPAQMKTAIQNWRDRKDKGQIAYKIPPSPLDTYKPIVPAAGAPGAK